MPMRASRPLVYAFRWTSSYSNCATVAQRRQKRTPKIGPTAKVESAPGREEEQTDEQEDKTTAGCAVEGKGGAGGVTQQGDDRRAGGEVSAASQPDLRLEEAA